METVARESGIELDFAQFEANNMVYLTRMGRKPGQCPILRSRFATLGQPPGTDSRDMRIKETGQHLVKECWPEYTHRTGLNS